MLLFHIRRSGPERKKSHRPLHGLWRYASDPKRRRWQIVPVRPAGCGKKKVISSTPFSAARRSGVFEPKPSANSIPTSDGNVNTEKFSTACPTHIKRACGIASQTLLLYMYDAVLRRWLTSRRRCRSDRPCCRCSGPDSRRWYSAPPPWARPRPRNRSGASLWCHRRT